MPGYVYKGTQFDAHIPIIEKPRQIRNVKNPAKCGTIGGFSRHRRQGTEVCGPCKDIKNILERDRKRRKRAGV